jgi:hypothetical protein
MTTAFMTTEGTHVSDPRTGRPLLLTASAAPAVTGALPGSPPGRRTDPSPSRTPD